jgi:hypothetical protein
MKPPARIKQDPASRKRKSKSMPDLKKSKKKGPYGPFFYLHMQSTFPTLKATFQHETHCSNMKTHCSNMSKQRAHVSEQDNLENCELQFSNEKACFCRCNILFTGYAFRITKQQKEEKKWQTQKNFLK